MFRNLIGKSLALSVRAASTAAPKEKWDLYVGVLVERLPVITKKLNAIEEEMKVSENFRFTRIFVDIFGFRRR